MGCTAGKNRKTVDTLNSGKYLVNGKLRLSFEVKKKKKAKKTKPVDLAIIHEVGSQLEYSVNIEKDREDW